MNLEIIEVTPEIATSWLASNNDKNRKLSKVTVNRYASDMIRGEWQITGEAIKFDDKGKLIDGQHRLAAIVASKQTIKMCVIRNLPTESMLVIDTGKSRSAGDALSIAGHNGSSTELAALARKIIAYRGGVESVLNTKKITIKNQPITNRDIVNFCAKNDLSEHTKFASRTKYHEVTNVLGNGEYAFFHWLFAAKDKDAAEEFLTRLATLENVSADSPIRALLKKLTTSSVRLDGKMKMYAMVTAWNAWRKNEKLTSIHVGRLESEPMPVPV